MGSRSATALVLSILLAATFFPAAACARAPGASGDVIAAIVGASSSVAAWLDGLSVTYTGMSLWMSCVGIVLIALIVGLIWWLRQPRKPAETRLPL